MNTKLEIKDDMLYRIEQYRYKDIRYQFGKDFNARYDRLAIHNPEDLISIIFSSIGKPSPKNDLYYDTFLPISIKKDDLKDLTSDQLLNMYKQWYRKLPEYVVRPIERYKMSKKVLEILNKKDTYYDRSEGFDTADNNILTLLIIGKKATNEEIQRIRLREMIDTVLKVDDKPAFYAIYNTEYQLLQKYRKQWI